MNSFSLLFSSSKLLFFLLFFQLFLLLLSLFFSFFRIIGIGQRIRIIFLFHDIFFIYIFLFYFFKLINIFLNVGFKNHHIIDKIRVIFPKGLKVSVILDETKFFLRIIMKNYLTLFCFYEKRIV